MKAVVVTGTPGTGKTAVAKLIAVHFGYRYVDINKVIKDANLSEGYDRSRRCAIVDPSKLSEALAKLVLGSSRKLVIDGHMSHFLPKKYVKMAIVTSCKLPVLMIRLQKRHYSAKKVQENLECEIFDVCALEAIEQGHKLVHVDTSQSSRECILQILSKRLK